MHHCLAQDLGLLLATSVIFNILYNLQVFQCSQWKISTIALTSLRLQCKSSRLDISNNGKWFGAERANCGTKKDLCGLETLLPSCSVLTPAHSCDWLLHWGQSLLGFSKRKCRTEEAILAWNGDWISCYLPERRMGETLVRVEILTLHLVNKEALVGASESAHEVQKSEP